MLKYPVLVLTLTDSRARVTIENVNVLICEGSEAAEKQRVNLISNFHMKPESIAVVPYRRIATDSKLSSFVDFVNEAVYNFLIEREWDEIEKAFKNSKYTTDFDFFSCPTPKMIANHPTVIHQEELSKVVKIIVPPVKEPIDAVSISEMTIVDSNGETAWHGLFYCQNRILKRSIIGGNNYDDTLVDYCVIPEFDNLMGWCHE